MGVIRVPQHVTRAAPQRKGVVQWAGSEAEALTPGVPLYLDTATLWSDDFSIYTGWTNIKSSFTASGGKAVTGSTGICLARKTAAPTDSRNVRIDVKLTLGGTSGSYYCAIPIRANLGSGSDADKFTGYAVRLTRYGDLSVWQVVANAFTKRINQQVATVATTTAERYMVIMVEGYLFRVWLSADATEPDITQPPTLAVYDYEELYSQGWVGIMAMSATAGQEKFDDLAVKELVHVESRPPRVYPDRPSEVTIQAEDTITDCRLIGPGGSSFELVTPGSIVGTRGGTLRFPTAFSGCATVGRRGNVLVDVPTGGYVLDVRTSGSRTLYPIEVREKPGVRFAIIGDTHVNTTTNPYYSRMAVVCHEIGEQIAWPRPDFVVHTGDVADGLTSGELANELARAKALLDGMRVPYHVVCGNHDTANGYAWDDDGAAFLATFGKISDTWAVGNFGFVLTSYTAGLGGYDASDQEACRAFIASALSSLGGKRKVLFHHAPWQNTRTDGGVDGYYESAPNAVGLIEGDGGVIACFHGHTHVTSRVEASGIHYIGAGSPANQLNWTYVELYADRMVVHRVPSRIFRADYQYRLWEDSTDPEHSTVVLYQHGQPNERTIVIPHGEATVLPEGALELLPYRVGDGTVSANVTPGAEIDGVGNVVAGLAFRAQDTANYYAALLTTGPVSEGEALLVKVVDNVVTVLDSASVDVDSGSTYALSIELSGSSIDVSVDSAPTLSASDSTFSEGLVGVIGGPGSFVVADVTYTS